MERDFKVYISIPIAGYHREEQKQMAHEAAMWLEARGLTAVNPFDNGLTENEERHKHMAKDIEMLLSCDAIMPVGRWQESVDVRQKCWWRRKHARRLYTRQSGQSFTSR